MKADGKLWAAIILLIVLVIALIVISIDRNDTAGKVNKALIEIQKLKQEKIKLQSVIKWHTPILGVDYFVKDGKDAPVYPAPKDGKDSVSTVQQVPIDNYQLALQDGFKGTLHDWLESLKIKGDKGDAADILLTSCMNGHQVQKLSTDSFWKPTLVGEKYIKCELSDD